LASSGDSEPAHAGTVAANSCASASADTTSDPDAASVAVSSNAPPDAIAVSQPGSVPAAASSMSAVPVALSPAFIKVNQIEIITALSFIVAPNYNDF
jgi:hypothetical protein